MLLMHLTSKIKAKGTISIGNFRGISAQNAKKSSMTTIFAPKYTLLCNFFTRFTM